MNKEYFNRFVKMREEESDIIHLKNSEINKSNNINLIIIISDKWRISNYERSNLFEKLNIIIQENILKNENIQNF